MSQTVDQIIRGLVTYYNDRPFESLPSAERIDLAKKIIDEMDGDIWCDARGIKALDDMMNLVAAGDETSAGTFFKHHMLAASGAKDRYETARALYNEQIEARCEEIFAEREAERLNDMDMIEGRL